MKVTDLRVDGFGVWSRLRLETLSDRVTVFYGANEAGKTTLMQFLRTIFYGFSSERRLRYLPPVHGGSAGGMLRVENNRQQLTIERHLMPGREEEEEEQLEIHAVDRAKLSPALLDQLLAGVDEPTFNNVFAVGLRELQELGTLDDTDAAELLYKLTTGLDRVSLVDVMQELDDVCRRLLDPGDPASRIVELQRRRGELEQRLDELAENGREWLLLETRRDELGREAIQLEQRIEKLTETSQIVDVAIQTQELWGRRGALERQLELLGPIPEIPAASLEKLEELQQTTEELRKRAKNLKRRRQEIRQEISLLPLNEKVGAHAARIEALNDLSPWIASLQTQVDRLRGEVQALEAKLAHSSMPLGLGEEVVPEQLPEISRRTLNELRAPARAVRDESQRLKQAQNEHETARQECDELVTELETALLDRGQEDLAHAVERTGSHTSRLRRRLQLEERLDQMTRRKTELRENHRDLLDDQVPSLKTLTWLGIPFVVGVMLLIGGLVWSSAASLGWPVAILGLAGWGVAVVAKISMERSAARDLEQCEKQLELVSSEIEQTQKEVEELAAELPLHNGNLQKKLEESENELATLEELVPLEAKVQTARQRVQAAQRRLDEVTESSKDAQGRWRSALRQASLPETLSPQAVRQLAEGNEHLLQARRQLELKREELSSREKELETLSSRIMQIAEEIEMSYTISDPQQLLNHLSVAASEQQALYERRGNLRREERKIQREGQRVVSQLRDAQTRRRAVLARAGVESEDELREIASREEKRQLLESELNEINEQITLALGNRFDFKQVERELIEYSWEELRERCATLQDQIHQYQEKLAALHQQQGALEQQSKTLLADRRMAETKLELGAVEQELHEATKRWRTLAVTASLLETVRVIYETHRQPQTLIDASRFFEELTDGHYVRIWTPLTDMSLRVDMHSGDSLPLDLLSCGTREAVFLSLRLALAADFARRGIMLPLVLDDVLVNFDRQRAAAAARVLAQFAQQGHQVLVFTCHEHIVELFSSQEDVSVRSLPHHADPDGTDHSMLETEPTPALATPQLDAETVTLSDEEEPVHDGYPALGERQLIPEDDHQHGDHEEDHVDYEDEEEDSEWEQDAECEGDAEWQDDEQREEAGEETDDQWTEAGEEDISEPEDYELVAWEEDADPDPDAALDDAYLLSEDQPAGDYELAGTNEEDDDEYTLRAEEDVPGYFVYDYLYFFWGNAEENEDERTGEYRLADNPDFSLAGDLEEENDEDEQNAAREAVESQGNKQQYGTNRAETSATLESGREQIAAEEPASNADKRFAWESPERYWQIGGGGRDAAA